jgi:3-hydroxyisobutyrate dehydrogenase-like beta-hydroxyacid dehydrogenase
MTEGMPKVGFIGFGEAASNMAAGLAEEGLRGIVAYDVAWQDPSYGHLIQGRARQAGATLVPDSAALMKQAEIIISATSASLAVPVAQANAPYLHGKLYADVNAASPIAMEKVSAIVVQAGGRFVDIAMMGPLSTFRHKVPMLASGPAAEEFHDAMTPYGMKISIVGDAPGRASAIKMFRSIVMKGLEALALEMMPAAHRFGADDAVIDSIMESTGMPAFKKLMHGLVTSDAIHAERRMHEMEEVIATLEEMGMDPLMSRATREKLCWSANLGLKEHFKGERPASYLDVLALMNKN